MMTTGPDHRLATDARAAAPSHTHILAMASQADAEVVGSIPPDATLIQIGRLVYRLGLFENLIGVVARNWMPDKERPVLAKFARERISKKLEAAERYIKPKTEAGLLALQGALTAARKALEIRNDVIHGMWMVDPTNDGRSVARNPAKGSMERIAGEVDEAAGLANEALRLLFVYFKEQTGTNIPAGVPFYSKIPPGVPPPPDRR